MQRKAITVKEVFSLIKNNDLAELTDVLSRFSMKMNDIDWSVTWLQYAASLGNLEIVRLLLKSKANPNGITEYNAFSPIAGAIGRGDLEIIQLLLDHGASTLFSPDQHSLILFIRSLYAEHHKLDVKGLCFAEKHAAMEAFLLGDEAQNQYYARLRNIDLMIINAVKDALKKILNEKHDDQAQSGKQNKPWFLKARANYQQQKEKTQRKERFIALIKSNLKTSLMSKLDQEKTDILAFFDKITLYQFYDFLKVKKSLDGKSKYAETDIKIFPLTLSEEMKNRGGMDRVTNFDITMKKADMVYALNSLKAEIGETTIPVAIALNAERHSIFVGFDPVKKQWLFHDINRIYNADFQRFPIGPQYYDNQIDVVDRVFESFGNKEQIKFTMQIFVSAYDQPQVDGNPTETSNSTKIKSQIDVWEASINKKPWYRVIDVKKPISFGNFGMSGGVGLACVVMLVLIVSGIFTFGATTALGVCIGAGLLGLGVGVSLGVRSAAKDIENKRTIVKYIDHPDIAQKYKTNDENKLMYKTIAANQPYQNHDQEEHPKPEVTVVNDAKTNLDNNYTNSNERKTDQQDCHNNNSSRRVS